MNSDDRRKHDRLGPLLIRAECRNERETLDGYLINLSQGGAYLAASSTLVIGDTVHLWIRLPWKLGEVEAEAKVVWRSAGRSKDDDLPDGVGLAFTHLDQEAGQKLQLYMSRFARLAALIEDTA